MKKTSSTVNRGNPFGQIAKYFILCEFTRILITVVRPRILSLLAKSPGKCLPTGWEQNFHKILLSQSDVWYGLKWLFRLFNVLVDIKGNTNQYQMLILLIISCISRVCEQTEKMCGLILSLLCKSFSALANVTSM